MDERLLLEILERKGLVTACQLSALQEEAGGNWQAAAAGLLRKKRVVLCRLDHGRETLLSLHLLFCLRVVCGEYSLTAAAQEVYDFLAENGAATLRQAQSVPQLASVKVPEAFAELQRKVCIMPLVLQNGAQWQEEGRGGMLDAGALLWVCDEAWMQGVRRPVRYGDLEYCLAELRRLLAGVFSTRELNTLLYQGALE
ncbi:hypothetical protein LJC04_04320 [Ruminococcaceae bacterium OttesenSCG-928-O06]|nr:hypothetical protein [Ruminococcaceae bacterium OttesenSCG-928-O06]